MRTLIFACLVGLQGCSVIQDVGSLEEDFSCGVDIGLREFFPHAQRPGTTGDVSLRSQVRQRFGVYVVRGIKEPSGEFRRQYVARAFFDPLPSSDVDIRLPFAIEAAENGDELPATLELHADMQNLREFPETDFFEISTIPDDHSWVFPHACSVEGTVFGHVGEFDQLEPATEGSLELKVRPSSEAAAQFWVETTFEVRVIRDDAIINGQEVDQAVALYRRGAATDIPDADIDDAEIDLGGVINEGENVEVIVFADRNGNGVFDLDRDTPSASDFAVNVDLALAQEGGVLPCLPSGSPPLGRSVCVDGTDVIVEIMLRDALNDDLITESWWNAVDP